jgi:hypothetical protein
MPAVAAEVNSVKTFLGRTGQELLPVDGDRPAAGRLERREGVASARDELVKLEGEKAARIGVRIPGALALGNAGHEQQLPQSLAAGIRRTARFHGERVDSFALGERARATPALVDV